jgi:hypothetical protein
VLAAEHTPLTDGEGRYDGESGVLALVRSRSNGRYAKCACFDLLI